MTCMKKRWIVLFIVAFVMMMGYFFWDIISPLSTTLKYATNNGGMGWTAAEYGFYAGSYSFFNIFLLMLFWGGVILDKMGIKFTGILATGMMFIGAFINYLALELFPPTDTVVLGFNLFGLIPSTIKVQVLFASLGFGIFGVGCDITGITISKIITKWFTGHELASAMGVQVAMARLGTAGAISVSPIIASGFGISAPLFIGTLALFIGFIMFIFYCFYFNRPNPNEQAAQSLSTNNEKVLVKEESFSLTDLWKVLKNPGFWLIALLCMLFYASIRPFLKFATDLLVNKYSIDSVSAGLITSILPYGTIILTPLFGRLYDKIGRGASLMLIGCVIVSICHTLLALPMINSTWFAGFIMVFLGIAFSLVPSAMWPSVPKIVAIGQLGTAYSIIYFIQNLGLMLVPIWIGNIIGLHTESSGRVDFTVPMLVFTGFGILATIVAATLLRIDGKYNFGLEKPNIKKES